MLKCMQPSTFCDRRYDICMYCTVCMITVYHSMFVISAPLFAPLHAYSKSLKDLPPDLFWRWYQSVFFDTLL